MQIFPGVVLLEMPQRRCWQAGTVSHLVLKWRGSVHPCGFRCKLICWLEREKKALQNGPVALGDDDALRGKRRTSHQGAFLDPMFQSECRPHGNSFAHLVVTLMKPSCVAFCSGKSQWQPSASTVPLLPGAVGTTCVRIKKKPFG